mgnify:FL=1
MTSTESTKKKESDGQPEPECQEDGSNGADYRGSICQEQKNNFNKVKSGSSPSPPKEM